MISIYPPPLQNSEFFVNVLTNIDHFRNPFDNHIIMGDFNMEPNQTILKQFLDSNILNNLDKGQTWFNSFMTEVPII